jgi:Fur family iron response transcriptional regulator
MATDLPTGLTEVNFTSQRDAAPMVRTVAGSTIKSKLRDLGIRPTRQRIQLGQLLFSNGDRHFTAEMIYDEARVFRPRPVLATVYNTLREFADRGLLREVAVYGNKVWFDTKTGPHFHFYVDKRDELFDIPDDWVPEINIPVPAGMRVAGIDVVVRLEPIAAADEKAA